MKRHQLYATSFEDLKTNFWSRETLVDNTCHLGQIFFILLKVYSQQWNIYETKCSYPVKKFLFPGQNMAKTRWKPQSAMISQGHKSTISSDLLTEGLNGKKKPRWVKHKMRCPNWVWWHSDWVFWKCHVLKLHDKGAVISHSDHRHYFIYKVWAYMHVCINMLICINIHKICMPS